MLPSALVEFFQGNHIICLATASGGQSYSTPLFYHFVSTDVEFYFLSSLETRHADDAIRNDRVSAAIYAPSRDVSKLQGAQMIGRLAMNELNANETAVEGYLERFPESQSMLGDAKLRFWTLSVDWVKFTDNTVHFGYKQIWSRS